ncbi:piggyBac transposable element-derived protein 4 [Halyomorpha halys]|uniref:piggyBac transposable element-derived protein 4 n=1 Tax=Halyomorpha halys TaxID=286706 RepID=UPI0006D5241E|nr:piggyBac transposable element-derived protein 4-like [Halyomorpha halys]
MTSQTKIKEEKGRTAFDPQMGELLWAKSEEHDLEELLDEEDRIDGYESDADSEHPDHETDSEQSESERDSDPHDIGDSSNCYIGKDAVTIWYAHAPRQNVHTPKKNCITHLPGVKTVARNAQTPIDCWKLFFPDSMVEKICLYTNQYLKMLGPSYARTRDCRETDLAEIHAVLGLLYMAGIKKAQHLNIKELWATDGTAPECFRATMSLQRFQLLLRALRFDDLQDRDSRKAVDNLAAIRVIFEEFNSHCKNNYEVGEYSTIDEMFEPFRGRCVFRQYIPNRPSKYGIKMYALVDSCTLYTSNLEIYAGRQPDGPYNVNNTASEVVMRIAEPILNTGRNITLDNYFTSIPLASELLEKKTTIVGTLRKNKKEIPVRFIETNRRDLHSSLFGFTKTSVLVSYKVKHNKNVLVLSTLHKDHKIDTETGDLLLPEVITFYNLTKGAVDMVDRMKGLYSVARVSCRWPLTIFFGMMNIGGINSQIIFKANTNEIIERKIFLKNLSLALIKAHLISRSSIQNIATRDRQAMKRIAGLQNEEEDGNETIKTHAEGFCAYCPRRKNKKTKKICGKCKIPICPLHTVYKCTKC